VLFSITAMRAVARTILVVMVLAVWVLAAPLASASGACAAMGGMCEGPCGAASCGSPMLVTETVLPLAASLIVLASDRAPSAVVRLPDLPPKSPLLST